MIQKTTICYYTAPAGGNPIKKFLDSLLEKQQAKILRIFQYIEQYGLRSIIPHLKKLTGTPLWEIRILGRDNIRVIYVIARKNVILILHGFIKKSPKTSKKEIETALIRHREWQARMNKLRYICDIDDIKK